MNKSRRRLAWAIALSMSVPMLAHAAMWDENSAQGDLSNDRLAPSQLTLDPGTNLLTGNFGAPDVDYIAMTVPVGFELASIVTGVHNTTGLSRSFIGVQSGSVMTVPPTAADATGLLGWVHFSGQDGVNLLPGMGTPKAGSTGFTGALGAGQYTFWINETSSGPGLTYDLAFNVQAAPVPVPAAVWLLGPALLGIGGLRKNRRGDERRVEGSYFPSAL
jgi:hypothetical protein